MANWLDPFLKAAGHSQESLADALDVSRATINRLAQDHSKLKRPRAEAMAPILGVSVEDLMLNKAPSGVRELVYDDGDPAQPDVAPPHMPWSSSGKLVHIPDLNIFGGMGGGGLLEVMANDQGIPIDEEQLRGYWTFPEYIVRAFQDLTYIFALESRGDSMLPTIPGGTVVFVNVRQNSLPPDDLYAIDYGDGLMIKRVQLVPRTEKLQVISDNELYENYELPRSEVRIYGRVMGWFQWRR